ncbi:MAG: hypothetical protein ACJ77U_08485 [Chloroflexota bacterium]
MTTHDPEMDGPTPPARRRHRMMVALVAVAIAVVAADVLVSVAVGGGFAADDLLGVLGVLGFMSIGALILDRRPGEPVGRICIAIGLLFAVGDSLRLVVILMDAGPGPLPTAGVVLVVVASILVNMAILLGGPLLISRFPLRSIGRTQRRAEDVLLTVTAMAVVISTVQQQVLEFQWIDTAINPLHIDGLPVSDGGLFTLSFLTYGLTYLVTAFGLVRRYRDGGPVVRAQIRWFGASIGASLVFLVLIVIEPIWQPLGEFAWTLWIASLLLPPIGIAIAVLRYRLFDIDRIISNAIGYGLVTIVLFGIFTAVNLVLVSQVSPLVDNEGIAVAASTLLVAALFNPLRTKVQRSVDRRFHRARYDAQRLVSDFSGRLRNELDLPTLSLELASVAERAVQPKTTTLWLRGGEGR